VKTRLTKPIVASYGVVAAALVLLGWLHLATLLITGLFSFFALNKLCFGGRKGLALVLFLVLFAAVSVGSGWFASRAIKEFPAIASKVIPRVFDYADKHGIQFNYSDSQGIKLPISDLEDLREAAPNMMRQSAPFLGSFAKITLKELVMLVAGVVIALGIFLQREPKNGTGNDGETLYAHYYGLIQRRFVAFYQSFENVMGAQIVISSVNTVATAVYLLATSFPYATILIPLTFLCGLLPIIGNLISNILIVGIALGAVSPKMALWSLLFLVVIHKMEYLLNSKIIGSRIQHPMWMTLIGLILGEYLMGIPGVILAPALLHYIKVEGSRYAAPTPEPREEYLD